MVDFLSLFCGIFIDNNIGQALKVANIEFSKEITILNDPNEVIATLTKASKVLNEEGETEPAVIYNETPFPQEEREK